jgi:hypothetical protein
MDLLGIRGDLRFGDATGETASAASPGDDRETPAGVEQRAVPLGAWTGVLAAGLGFDDGLLGVPAGLTDVLLRPGGVGGVRGLKDRAAEERRLAVRLSADAG